LEGSEQVTVIFLEIILATQMATSLTKVTNSDTGLTMHKMQNVCYGDL
jgi:hypothetical protein